MIDIYGYEITYNGDGSYTRTGVTVQQPTIEAALNTFNGMIPDGWTPPE